MHCPVAGSWLNLSRENGDLFTATKALDVSSRTVLKLGKMEKFRSAFYPSCGD